MLDDDHETGLHEYSPLGWLTGRKQTPGVNLEFNTQSFIFEEAEQAICQQFRRKEHMLFPIKHTCTRSLRDIDYINIKDLYT